MALALIHGGDIEGYRERFGALPLDFSANLNPLGMPRGVKDAIVSAIEASAGYPDPLCRRLTAELAVYESVPAGYIQCGNGAADLIFRFVRAVKPERAFLPIPSFAEYEQALACVGCAVDDYPLSEEKGFLPDKDMLDALRDWATENSGKRLMFCLCNPNNPTGQTVAPKLLEELLLTCREMGVFVLLDECFEDFLEPEEQHSMTDRLAEFPNLLVLKAFTKLYAMAGVRLGYGLCSDRLLLEQMAGTVQPWSVSTLAQAAGIAALGEEDYRRETARLIREESCFLKQEFARLHLPVIGSKANFIFFRSPVSHLQEKLEPLGILLRSCDNYRGMPQGYCRAAVRTRADNIRLIAALEQVLKQEK